IREVAQAGARRRPLWQSVPENAEAHQGPQRLVTPSLLDEDPPYPRPAGRFEEIAEVDGGDQPATSMAAGVEHGRGAGVAGRRTAMDREPGEVIDQQCALHPLEGR